jgi:serine/threonine protein kinase
MLVTTFEKSTDIMVDDLLWYSISLIAAVVKLHKIGILHCDIKPSNVLWIAEKREVMLIDFGHAQKETAARSYPATKKYQAPEISQGDVHTRKSDAYSVGKTLEEALVTSLRRAVDEKWRSHEMKITWLNNGLLRSVASDRLSLEAALDYLEEHGSHDDTNGNVASGFKRKFLKTMVGLCNQ